MIHNERSPLAGKTVKIKSHITHPQVDDFGGAEFRVEDWHDRVMGGESWGQCNGNPACLVYGMRIGFSDENTPPDDEVLYGKIGALGHLVHVSEIDLEPQPDQ